MNKKLAISAIVLVTVSTLFAYSLTLPVTPSAPNPSSIYNHNTRLWDETFCKVIVYSPYSCIGADGSTYTIKSGEYSSYYNVTVQVQSIRYFPDGYYDTYYSEQVPKHASFYFEKQQCGLSSFVVQKENATTAFATIHVGDWLNLRIQQVEFHQDLIHNSTSVKTWSSSCSAIVQGWTVPIK